MYPFLTKDWAILPEHLNAFLDALKMDEPSVKGESPSSFYYNIIEAATGKRKSSKQKNKENAFNAVKVIPVEGVMLKKAPLFLKQWFGVRDMEDIANDISAANSNDEVKAIVLRIDSGGGQVDGTEQLGMAVANSRKPVVTFVDGTMASAAYWVGSSAKGGIVANGDLSMVGSIGVVTTHLDQSGFLNKMGLKVTHITSTKATNKIVAPSSEPLSPEALLKVREVLDPIHDKFEETVKSNRRGRLTSEAKNMIFDGSMFFAQKAMSLGMIDEIGNIEDAVVRAYDLYKGRSVQKGGSRADVSDNVTVDEDIDESRDTKAEKNCTDIIESDVNNADDQTKNENEMSLIEKIFGKSDPEAEMTIKQGEIDEVKAEVEKLREENLELTEKLSAASAAAETADADIETINSEANELRATIETLKAQVSEMEELKASNATLMEGFTSLKAKYEEATAEAEKVEGLQNEIVELKEANAKLSEATGSSVVAEETKKETKLPTKEPKTGIEKAANASIQAKDIIKQMKENGLI